LEKDLANAKILAGILEEEGAVLRKTTVKAEDRHQSEGDGMQTEEQTDTVMANPDNADDGEDDPEPKEKGSEAVERRIEKVMADLRDQGIVDINDEKAYETKKVGNSSTDCLNVYSSSISDRNFAGPVHRLPSGCVPHMLLLLHCNGSS
jgi:hypothetical protein